jgi:hypothetical protein
MNISRNDSLQTNKSFQSVALSRITSVFRKRFYANRQAAHSDMSLNIELICQSE